MHARAARRRIRGAPAAPEGLWLDARGLVTEESDTHQYRFQDIVGPDTGTPLFTIEHEVRSLAHPMWGRELVNRDPRQSVRAYRRGRDRLPI